MVILQTVLDALRARKERFVFEDIEVTLKSTVMAFITMNPGYPGRAELPESLKVRVHTLGANAQRKLIIKGTKVLSANHRIYRPYSGSKTGSTKPICSARRILLR